MKTMWCSESMVSEVQTFERGGVRWVRDPDGREWEPRPGTVHETEIAARRAWLLAQEAACESELGSIDTAVQLRETEIRRSNDWLKELAASRQRVEGELAGVRETLAQFDALQGRR